MENVNNTQKTKSKIEEIKTLIKNNSKDVHYAQKLINELISLQKQLTHQPTVVNIPLDDIIKSYKGDGWEMLYSKDNSAIYRTTGGYTLICKSVFNVLNQTISEVIDYMNGNINVDLTDDQKKAMETDIALNTAVLNLPLLATADLDFKLALIRELENYIDKLQEQISNSELPNETEDDELFKDYVLGTETIKQKIDEEVKDLKQKL